MKIKKNKIDYFLQILTFLIILTITIYVFINWQQIPQTIPGHYNINGVIDRYGDKRELLILILTSWGLFLAMFGLSFFPRIWNIPVSTQGKNKEKIYHITLYLLETMNLITTCIFCYLILYTLTNKNLPSYFWLYIPAIFITMIGFGIWLWKVQKER